MSAVPGAVGVEGARAGPSTRVLAHRGASALWPEHTRAAYLQALDDGADGLEGDIRVTADGVAVLWHDVTVDRTSDGSGPVHEHTLAALRDLRGLRGGGGGSGSAPVGPGTEGRPARYGTDAAQVLTVADLLGIAAGAGRPVHLAFELKHPHAGGFAAEDAVLAELERAGWDADRAALGAVTVSFMSFRPESLTHLGASVPGRHLMALLDERPRDHEGGGRAGTGVSAGVVRAEAQRARDMVEAGVVGGVGPGVALVRARGRTVQRWLAAGRLVRVWTVDADVDVDLCAAAGVQEVTSNDPGRVRRRLLGPGR